MLLSLPVLAEQRIETIELNHRLASEISPQIEIVLPPDAALSAYDNLLILKADSATQQQIRQLVSKLDQRLENTRISVLRTTQQLSDFAAADGNVNIDLTEPSQSSVQIRHFSTRDSRERDQIYQATGIEGQPVTIQLGELIPQPNQQILFTPRGGVIVGNQTQYLPVDSGFQAVVNLLSNDRMRVELYPQFAAFDRQTGQIDSTTLVTSLTGALNQWLLIGQIGEQSQQQGNTVYRSHQDEQQFIYLKIEVN